MHHPEICNIILTIEDYFILVDDNEPNYQLEPMLNNLSENSTRFGIKITRQLLNGNMQIEIYGEGKDDDGLAIKYYANDDDCKIKKCVQIPDNQYSREALRNAIRTILKFDKSFPDMQVSCS
jgi:hypothetical protein